jgi:hypothetical protein
MQLEPNKVYLLTTVMAGLFCEYYVEFLEFCQAFPDTTRLIKYKNLIGKIEYLNLNCVARITEASAKSSKSFKDKMIRYEISEKINEDKPKQIELLNNSLKLIK